MPCMPYGSFVFLPAMLAILACGLTFGFGFGCGMISFNWGGGTVTYFGPWTAELIELDGTEFDDATNSATVYYSSACYLYKNFQLGTQIQANFDAPIKTSRAFSMMAIVLAFPLMVVVMLPCCMVLPQAKRIYLYTAFACIFTMFSSFMALIMKKSQLCRDCEFGWSAWTCITAGLCWFFTAIAVYLSPDTPEPDDDGYPASAPAAADQQEAEK